MRLAHDLRFTLAALARRPVLALGSVALLAVAVFAVSILFAAAGSMLFRPLAYPNARHLAEVGLRGSWGRGPASHETLEKLRSGARSVERVEGYSIRRVAASRGDELELVTVAYVTPKTLELLGAAPLLGRGLSAEDGKAGSARVAVLSWEAWRRRYGADPNLLGRSVEIDGAPARVVGVLRRGFSFPGTLGTSIEPELYLPYRRPKETEGVRSRNLVVLVRRVPGLSWRSVRRELDSLLRERGVSPVVMPLRHAMLGAAEGPLEALLGVAWLIAVLSGCNLAILLLARTDARGGELAVRMVAGAAPWSVIRLVLLEAGLVAAAGTTIGLGAAAAVQERLLRPFRALLPTGIPVRVDGWVAVVVAGVTAAATLAATVPAGAAVLQVSYAALLKGFRPLSGGGAWAGRLRRMLVGLEVVLAAGTLTVTAAVARSVGRLVRVPLGFQPAGVVSSLLLPHRHLPAATLEQKLEIQRRLQASLGEVALATAVPLGETRATTEVSSSERRHVQVRVEFVTGNYLEVLGVPILEGRPFTGAEVRGGAPVAVVSRDLARRLWRDPEIGRQITLGEEFSSGNPMLKVVGIAHDLRADGAAQPPAPTVFLPLGIRLAGPFAAIRAQTPMYVVARTSVPCDRLQRVLRRAVRDVGCRLVVLPPVELSAQVRASLRSTLLLGSLLWGLTAAALALACGGVASLVAFWVVQRRREFGIRASCGATPERLVRDLFVEVARVAVPAAALGVAAGIVGASYVASRVPGLEGPPVMLAAAVVAAAALAGILGAAPVVLRVTQLDPASALRYE